MATILADIPGYRLELPVADHAWRTAIATAVVVVVVVVVVVDMEVQERIGLYRVVPPDVARTAKVMAATRTAGPRVRVHQLHLPRQTRYGVRLSMPSIDLAAILSLCNGSSHYCRQHKDYDTPVSVPAMEVEFRIAAALVVAALGHRAVVQVAATTA